MKKMTAIFFASLVVLTLMPMISLVITGKFSAKNLISQSDKVSYPMENERTVSVFLETSERKITISELEYTCGVVACEMPMTYEDEALKAQAVAAFTMLKRRQEEHKSGSVSGSDANFVISSSSSSVQGYITEEQMKAKWGDDFEEYYARLKNLVASVADEYIAYDGKPILAAYHSISCGMTEDAANVWGEKFSYLSAVPSVSDSDAPGYLSEEIFTEQEFKKICAEKLNISLSGEPAQWLGDCVRSDSGYVMSCGIGKSTVTGQKIRNAFKLRSACFTLKYSDGKFKFTVRGYGHGVGMSQYGANEMAKRGANYREIIKYYYSGTEIDKR